MAINRYPKEDWVPFSDENPRPHPKKSTLRMTHTYAILEVSHAAYSEIKALLEAAGYQDQIHDNRDGDGVVIDMHGIALKDERESNETTGHR